MKQKIVFKSMIAITLVLTMMLACAMPAMGAVVKYKVVQDGELRVASINAAGKVTIQGVIQTTAGVPKQGIMATIYVTKVGETVPIYINSAVSQANGKFSKEFTFLDGVDPMGKYEVTISGQDFAQTSTYIFTYKSQSFKDSFMQDFVSATSGAVVFSLFIDNLEMLEVTDPDRVTATIASALFSNKAAYTTIEQVESAINVAISIEQFKGKPDQVRTVIAANNYYFGLTLDYQDEPANISDTNIYDKDWWYNDMIAKGRAQQVFERIAAESFHLTDITAFRQRFNELVGLSAISQNRDWGICKDLYSQIQRIVGSSVFAIDFTGDFRLVKHPNEVFRRMFDKINRYDTYAGVTSAFNQAVKDQLKSEEPQTPGLPPSGPGNIVTGSGSGVITQDQTKIAKFVIPAVVNPNVTFNDIDQVAWAKSSILNLATRNIVAGMGDGNFAPNEQVTREQFLKMLIESLGIKADGATVSFSDAKAGEWYYNYLAIGQKTGLVSGRPDGSFGVGSTITREEMCVMAYRAVQLVDGALKAKVAEMYFADEAEFASYAVEAIKIMQKAGILNGVGDNRFDPRGTATRAMSARVIDSLITTVQE